MKEKIDQQRWKFRKQLVHLGYISSMLLGLAMIIITPVSAVTTSIHIVKYANDGTTILNETTKTYQWLEANLPVLGDGTTHYYSQGPTFNDSDPWDNAEWQNVDTRDWGAVKGTDLKNICNLVGGMSGGETVNIRASDGFSKLLPYEYVYTPNSRQGPIGITWYRADQGYVSSYTDGMRLVMFADAKTNTYGWNTSGWHVFGNADMRDCWAPGYRYNYSGIWPSSGGVSVKSVSEIIINSNQAPPVAPQSAFTVDIQSGTAPLTVHFTDQSTGTPPLAYAWDFNNDRTVDSTIRNPSYTYTTAGTYTVNLTVTNIAGSDSEQKTNFITVNQAPVAPVAAFMADVQSGTAPLVVHFTDQSTNTPTLWMWEYRSDTGSWTEFGSGARNPSYIFTAGTYDIRLTVTNDGGTDNELKTDYIASGAPATPPVADFMADDTSGSPPLAVRFTDLSTGTGISVWNWDFNNDRVIDSTIRNPTFTYTSPGIYTVNLTVTGTGGRDSEIKTNYIMVTTVPSPHPETHIGVFRSAGGNWYLDTTKTGAVTATFHFGKTGDIPVIGDWDGNGITDAGIFRPLTGNWYLDTTKTGSVTATFHFGKTGDIPVIGDWDSNGITDAGIFRPSTGNWYLDTTKTGIVNKTFHFGTTGDTPVVGNWTPGTPNIGVFRNSSGNWYLDTTRTGVVAETFHFGKTGDIPVIGDWNGNGVSDVGIFRSSNGCWYLDTTKTGTAATTFRFGKAGDIPVVGDWNGNGITDVGVFRPSSGNWYLDTTKTGAVNKSFHFGTAGDIPILGNWN